MSKLEEMETTIAQAIDLFDPFEGGNGRKIIEAYRKMVEDNHVFAPGMTLMTSTQADRLRKDSEQLNRLKAAGVDNWEGYSSSFADEDDDEEDD